MTHEDIYRFHDTVQRIRDSGGTLSDYFPREIADAIQSLIDAALTREREACAMIAESAAEAAGTLDRGKELHAPPEQSRACLEIAAQIRNRR